MLPLSEIAAVMGVDYPALTMYAGDFGNAVTLAALPALAFVAFGSHLRTVGNAAYEALRLVLIGYILGMLAFPIPVGYILYAVAFQLVMAGCGLAVLYSKS